LVLGVEEDEDEDEAEAPINPISSLAKTPFLNRRNFSKTNDSLDKRRINE
jgi:hypothetical protein